MTIDHGEPKLPPFLFRVLVALDEADLNSSLFWRAGAEYPEPKFYVTCSDAFYWASADLEEITADNVHLLEQAVADTKALDCMEYADVLFCARSRRMRPQRAFYDGLSKALVTLLDACGPERDV